MSKHPWRMGVVDLFVNGERKEIGMKKRLTVNLSEKQYEMLVMAKAELEKSRKRDVTLGQTIAEASIVLIDRLSGNLELAKPSA